MIARIIVPIFLMIIVADVFIDLHYLRRIRRHLWWKRLAWWLPAVVLMVFTVILALERNFGPKDNRLLNVYLFLLGMVVIPKFVFAVCSGIGWLVRRAIGGRRNYGHYVGVALALVQWFVLVWGSFVGSQELNVRRITYTSPDLPAAFDGYRIVQFSDAHVGTWHNNRYLQRAVDSIRSLHPGVIVFTGDLQNLQPSELTPHAGVLASLAKDMALDGVYSVLGNHDYAVYIDGPESLKAHNCREMVSRQQQMGWKLLRNSSAAIRRGADSIVIAGMENDAQSGRGPKRGDVGKTLRGVSPRAFVVMLEHDPTAWRRKILPESNAQLTLSGHTHAMQFELGDWSPAALLYREWGGVYYEGRRAINVSTGLGGFIPFRFGVPGEIVEITLRKSR